jgi:hypothetical protein
MSPIVNLSPYHFKQLILSHYSVDEVYLLQLAIQNYNLEDFKEKKISILIKKMTRNGLLTEEGIITEAGKKLWESLFQEGEELQLNKIEQTVDDFEIWWQAYPANNGFEHKGKKFPVTRSMRVKKDDCKVKFHSIISEGQYTPGQLINAIHTEVKARKEESVRKKENQLSYMKSTLPYLNARGFEGFIDLDPPTNNNNQTQKFL